MTDNREKNKVLFEKPRIGERPRRREGRRRMSLEKKNLPLHARNTTSNLKIIKSYNVNI